MCKKESCFVAFSSPSFFDRFPLLLKCTIAKKPISSPLSPSPFFGPSAPPQYFVSYFSNGVRFAVWFSLASYLTGVWAKFLGSAQNVTLLLLQPLLLGVGRGGTRPSSLVREGRNILRYESMNNLYVKGGRGEGENQLTLLG